MDGDSKAERALWVSARETQLRAAGGGPWKREGRGWSPTLRSASCPRHRGPVRGGGGAYALGGVRGGHDVPVGAEGPVSIPGLRCSGAGPGRPPPSHGTGGGVRAPRATEGASSHACACAHVWQRPLHALGLASGGASQAPVSWRGARVRVPLSVVSRASACGRGHALLGRGHRTSESCGLPVSAQPSQGQLRAGVAAGLSETTVVLISFPWLG